MALIKPIVEDSNPISEILREAGLTKSTEAVRGLTHALDKVGFTKEEAARGLMRLALDSNEDSIKYRANEAALRFHSGQVQSGGITINFIVGDTQVNLNQILIPNR